MRSLPGVTRELGLVVVYSSLLAQRLVKEIVWGLAMSNRRKMVVLVRHFSKVQTMGRVLHIQSCSA